MHAPSMLFGVIGSSRYCQAKGRSMGTTDSTSADRELTLGQNTTMERSNSKALSLRHNDQVNN